MPIYGGCYYEGVAYPYPYISRAAETKRIARIQAVEMRRVYTTVQPVYGTILLFLVGLTIGPEEGGIKGL